LFYQIKELYANMFSKLHVLFLAENVVGDNVILIDDSHDAHANAQVLETTTTPMYIPVVFGDHDMENSLIFSLVLKYETIFCVFGSIC